MALGEDGLGSEVVPVGELKEDVKLPLLEKDCSRLQWAKMRSEHVSFFGYPSLHPPPKIMRMLIETLLQPIVNEGEDSSPCVSDEELCHIIDPNKKMSRDVLEKTIHKRRTSMVMAIRSCLTLELMQRVFREPSMIKKCQEVLHHLFHHGYVRLVREVAKANLSNYATFHGSTYTSPFNNCVLAHLMEGVDKEDYIVDTIYLFCVMTWQTAMGMWQQAIDDHTIEIYKKVFVQQRRALYSISNVNELTKTIANMLMDGDVLTSEMRKALPNFITQSQVSAFRNFLLERSNISSFAAPFLPTDFIPLVYKQCPTSLWEHCYLLQLSYFLMNHGGYLWESPQLSDQNKTYCPCNLCSPHRMPQHNMALHNEILAIGTFEFMSPDGKSFKLTPELWTNKYLDKFVPGDFHPLTVAHFSDHESMFSKQRDACVTSSPELFELIRQISKSREEFLLTKGKGTYKDPVTGETISVEACERKTGLPPTCQSGGIAPQKTTVESLPTNHGQLVERDGPTHGRRESKGVRACRRGGGSYRRRVVGEQGFRDGGLGSRSGGSVRERAHTGASEATEAHENRS